jgi:hypothetical protein
MLDLNLSDEPCKERLLQQVTNKITQVTVIPLLFSVFF